MYVVTCRYARFSPRTTIRSVYRPLALTFQPRQFSGVYSTGGCRPYEIEIDESVSSGAKSSLSPSRTATRGARFTTPASVRQIGAGSVKDALGHVVRDRTTIGKLPRGVVTEGIAPDRPCGRVGGCVLQLLQPAATSMAARCRHELRTQIKLSFSAAPTATCGAMPTSRSSGILTARGGGSGGNGLGVKPTTVSLQG